MPVTGSPLIILTAAAIALLLVLILGVKLHAFLGLILTAMALGLATDMPIFCEVGVGTLGTLLSTLARETRRSMLFYVLPMLGALTVVHALVPAHAAPAAASQLLGSNIRITILYGIGLALPMTVAAGI